MRHKRPPILSGRGANIAWVPRFHAGVAPCYTTGMAETETVIEIGSTVLIERDEKRYPSRGSWPRYSDRLGTVVTINNLDAEYGVAFGNIRTRPDGSIHGNEVSWFRLHELTRVQEGD
jgi:hypothetical protein